MSSQIVLFACSKCFSRHPFEELSTGQQLCKVKIFLFRFAGGEFFEIGKKQVQIILHRIWFASKFTEETNQTVEFIQLIEGIFMKNKPVKRSKALIISFCLSFFFVVNSDNLLWRQSIRRSPYCFFFLLLQSDFPLFRHVRADF